MGVSLIWIALQGRTRAEVLELAGLEDTGEPDDFFESSYSIGELPGGWVVLVADDFDLLDEDTLRQWSAGRRLVAGMVEEHVMMSATMEWTNGAPVWSVSHDGEDGGDELEVAGDLPPAFADIVAGLKAQEAEQARREPLGPDMEVDFIFDAPLDLAEAITGFRHDQAYDGVFTAAEPADA